MQDSASRVVVFDLTDRQRKIYDWIYFHAMMFGYQPSYRSAAAHFKIKTARGLSANIYALARKGFVDLAGECRALRFLKRPDGEPFAGFIDLPGLVGNVDALVSADQIPTPSQRDIFQAIYSHARNRGYQPSIMELMDCYGFTSPNAILGPIKVLARKGWVSESGAHRAVRFLRRPDGLPFRGFADKEGGAR